MKLVVGLGNPGKEYENTRHNVGFKVLDNYLKDVSWKEKFNALYYKPSNEEIIYIKPMTYMNMSGNSIIQFVNFYKIDTKDILVIQDDLDLERGKYRIKHNSSSGGHNGIQSIIDNLSSNEFYRLKIGIGKDELVPADKYVLSKLSKEENELINSNYEVFNNIIDYFKNDDIEKAIEKYNKR